MSLLPEISQASAEINKLVAQANIHQTIARVDPAAFTDPADTMLLASRDPVIREVSVGMTGVEAAPYTVSGTPPLSLPNSLGKPLKAWEVDVVPKQDLNGYDAPWPAGGRVNKFGPNEAPKSDYYLTSDGVEQQYIGGGWMISDYIAVEANTQYTFNPNSTYGYSAYFGYYDANKDLISTVSSHNVTFTTPADCAYMRFSYRDTSTDIMLVLGSTSPATYSPYSNLCPIHGTDKLNLFVEESYDQSATPKAVLTLPQTVYTGTIGSEGGESRSVLLTFNTATMNNTDDFPGWSNSGIRAILGEGLNAVYTNQRMNVGKVYGVNTTANYDILFLPKPSYGLTQSQWIALAVDVQIEVILPTLIQFPLTSPTIPTPTGTATTWATAEDGTVESMEVTYYKSE